jgi:hypothetical protein
VTCPDEGLVGFTRGGGWRSAGHDREARSRVKEVAGRIFATLAAVSVAMSIGPAYAAKGAAESRDQPSVGTHGYVPGLGEVMALQQMRHAKLWLAGERGNWSLAAYELDELREGFQDASTLHPTYEGIPVAALIDRLTPARLEAIGKAIEAKDSASFIKSFDGLTQTCNACHRAANRGFIVITRPSGPAFDNQSFAPTQ